MIRVLVPSMPVADELLPLLREIDDSKVYVNGGQLVRRLERELEQLVHNPCRAVANGTVSLELALRALDLPRGSHVLVPAVTYVASGQAIVNAGLVPVLCDVDAKTWQLDAEAAGAAAAQSRLAAVMPVAAFGAPVPVDPWERFTYETGLPVLIDAAGAIYGQQASPIPEIIVSYSLHATKALGAGEGGLVATCDRLLLERVEALATFGPSGTNAKMSEYHAAVALASLRRNQVPIFADWRAPLARWYATWLPQSVTQQAGPAQLARTLFPVLLPEGADAPLVAAALQRAGIESRAWYRPFLVERPEFFDFPMLEPMPNTEMLRARLLGLPWHAYLTEEDVARVCSELADHIKQ